MNREGSELRDATGTVGEEVAYLSRLSSSEEQKLDIASTSRSEERRGRKASAKVSPSRSSLCCAQDTQVPAAGLSIVPPPSTALQHQYGAKSWLPEPGNLATFTRLCSGRWRLQKEHRACATARHSRQCSDRTAEATRCNLQGLPSSRFPHSAAVPASPPELRTTARAPPVARIPHRQRPSRPLIRCREFARAESHAAPNPREVRAAPIAISSRWRDAEIREGGREGSAPGNDLLLLLCSLLDRNLVVGLHLSVFRTAATHR